MSVSLVRFCPLAPAGWRKPEAVLLERVPGSIPSCCAPVGDSGAGLRSIDYEGAAEGLWMSVYAPEKGFGAKRLGVSSSDIRDSCRASLARQVLMSWRLCASIGFGNCQGVIIMHLLLPLVPRPHECFG
jgi:hypothetical protein